MTTFVVSMDEKIEYTQSGLKIDKASFEEAFHMHYEALMRYCGTMVQSIAEAEDIVQSVFLDLWNDRNKMIYHTSLKAFLYKGVYFKCMNAHKHKKVSQKYVKKHKGEEPQWQSDSLIAQEIQQKIKQTIDGLPEQCKKIFTMSRFHELKYHEIAEKLSLSPKTVENQMSKALKTMRVALAEYIKIIVIIFTLQLL